MLHKVATDLNVASPITYAMQQQTWGSHRGKDRSDVELPIHRRDRFDSRRAGAGALIPSQEFTKTWIARNTGGKEGGHCTSSPIFVEPLGASGWRRRRRPARTFAKRPIKHDTAREVWV